MNFACSTCNRYLDERCKKSSGRTRRRQRQHPGIVSVQSDRIPTPQTGMLWHGSEAAPNPQSTIPDAGHGTTRDNTPGIVSVQSDRIQTPQMGIHVWFGSEAAPIRNLPFLLSKIVTMQVQHLHQSLRRHELVFQVLIRIVHQINFILCIHSPCSAYNSFA